MRARRMNKALRWAVLERDAFTCRYCGQRAPNVELQVDHIYPHSRGGEDTFENLVTACRDCNAGKRVRDSRHAISLSRRLDDAEWMADSFRESYAHVQAAEDELRLTITYLTNRLRDYEDVYPKSSRSHPLHIAEILRDIVG